MQAPAGAGAHTFIESFGDPGDGYWWYSVSTADATPLQIFLPSSATTTCSACQSVLYPSGFSCSSLPAGGVDARWDGTAIAGQSSCLSSEGSSATRLSCSTRQCVPAGHYNATMCAFTSAQSCGRDPIGDHGTCVSVPFDYPTTSVVVGTLPQ